MSDDIPSPEWLASFFREWDDPCPLEAANPDGLLRDWRDPTYANIPYSDPMPWVEKAIAESRRGVRVVLLVRADPSTRWWLKLMRAGARAWVLQGRLEFADHRRGTFPYPSALVFL